MMGNVWEWNETLIHGSNRGTRGGGWATEGFGLAKTVRYPDVNPGREWDTIGFRVASVVPVPSALLLGGIGLAVANWKLRRKRC